MPLVVYHILKIYCAVIDCLIWGSI